MTKSLADLFNRLEGYEIVSGDPSSATIDSITLDSRSAGPGALFIAIPGTAADATLFVPDALKKGAEAVLVQKDRLSLLDPADDALSGAVVAAVPDARRAASVLAHLFYNEPSKRLEITAITGTNGKTTTAFILYSIYQAAGRRPGLMGTVEYRFEDESQQARLTTPDPVTTCAFLDRIAGKGADSAVMEVSSHALDQKRVSALRFKTALFTNLSHDHLDYHGDAESYFVAKASLFLDHSVGSAVINLDDPWGRRLLSLLEGLPAGRRPKIFTYGLDAEADIRAEGFSFSLAGMEMSLILPGGEKLQVKSRLIGRHNLYNILAAAAAAAASGLDCRSILNGIEAARNVPGRLEPVTSPEKTLALVDYAHTPDAVTKVLACLRELGPRRIITVIGCGGDRDREKRPEMARAALEGSDIVFITSDNPRTEEPSAIIADMLSGLFRTPETRPEKGLHVVTDRRQAIFQAADLIRPGDILLVAGKGHEDYQIIGTRRIPFDDRQVLREAFSELEHLRSRFFNLEAVQEACGGRILCPDTKNSHPFFSISTDTRTIQPGELFWALTGENFDGNLFVQAALEKGAAGAAAKRGSIDLEGGSGPVLELEDTLEALGDFAAFLRKGLDLKVVGITGSCGKTTTKEILAAICSGSFTTLKTEGNLNNLIGLPLTLLRARPWHQLAILEMGTNRPGEIPRLSEIALPDLSIITCIRPAHLEGLGSLEAVAREKLSLFRGTKEDGTLIVNMDDPLIMEALEQEDLKARRLIGFGFEQAGKGPRAGRAFSEMVLIKSWRPVLQQGKEGLMSGIEMELRMAGRTVRLFSPLAGRAAAVNIAAAASAALALGINAEQIADGVQKVELPFGRMNICRAGRAILLDDCYNANPASVEMALETLAALPGIRTRVAVLADMMELGEEEELFHRQIGRRAAEQAVDILLAVGPKAKQMARAAQEAGMARDRVKWFPDTKSLCSWLDEAGLGGLGIGENGHGPFESAVLLKGSRAMRLEEAVDRIKRLADAEKEGKEGS